MEQTPAPLGSFCGNCTSITKLQQIDSLHTVAQADSSWTTQNGNTGTIQTISYFIATTDGGKTWSRPHWPDSLWVMDFHFSSPLTGIFVTNNSIYCTSDGGERWEKQIVPVRGGPEACHSYGDGMFRVWGHAHGPLYTTRDNWSSYDTTQPCYDSSVDAASKTLFGSCNFGSGDTIMCYGIHFSALNPSIHYGSLARTTDGGSSWTHFRIADSINAPSGNGILYTTSLDHDTVYAAGESFNHWILRSTDRGATWSIDTLLLDTSMNVLETDGIAMTGDGHPLALFSFRDLFINPTLIFRREQDNSIVTTTLSALHPFAVYPNPSTDWVNVRSSTPLRRVVIRDLLGRPVLYGMADVGGEARLDVSKLPAGMYELETEGENSTGKISILR